MVRYLTFVAYLALAALSCLGPLALFASDDSKAADHDPKQLVRAVAANELRASDKDHSQWMYRERDVEPGKNVVQECVDTNSGQLCRVLERNGHILTPGEQQQELNRLQQLVKNPAGQKKKEKARQEDDRKAAELVNMLPHGFLYQYEGEEGGNIRLRFWPNPDFTPPSREATVFHCMAGTLLIDARQKRLADMKGTLIHNVEFGWGLLGRLSKGGTFQVRRQDAGGGHWVNTLLDVHIRGKALFFKTINAEQHEVDEDFKRVPDHLSLAQGVSMLQAPGLQASARRKQ